MEFTGIDLHAKRFTCRYLGKTGKKIMTWLCSLLQSARMFVDFSGGDWHLAGTAPLNIRGGGIAISGLTADKDGVPRTASTPTGMTNTDASGWSTGAYEKD